MRDWLAPKYYTRSGDVITGGPAASIIGGACSGGGRLDATCAFSQNFTVHHAFDCLAFFQSV